MAKRKLIVKITDSTPTASKDWSTWAPLLIALILAFLAAGTYWHWFYRHLHIPLSVTADTWGQFGDYFGGLLNPVIAACTLFVAVRVWQLQKRELQDTRCELQAQRNQQRFFDLLSIYQSTIDSITLLAKVNTNTIHPYSGKEAVAHFFRNPEIAGGALRDFLANDEWSQWIKSSTTSELRSALQEDWRSPEISSLFSHYFRVVFRLLKEAEPLLGAEHFRYAKLFRAQLSGPELTLIGFNLWLDPEGQKMIPIAEQYGLLKHLPSGPLRTKLEKELNRCVFGRKFSQEHPFPHMESR